MFWSYPQIPHPQQGEIWRRCITFAVGASFNPESYKVFDLTDTSVDCWCLVRSLHSASFLQFISFNGWLEMSSGFVVDKYWSKNANPIDTRLPNRKTEKLTSFCYLWWTLTDVANTAHNCCFSCCRSWHISPDWIVRLIEPSLRVEMTKWLFLHLPRSEMKVGMPGFPGENSQIDSGDRTILFLNARCDFKIRLTVLVFGNHLTLLGPLQQKILMSTFP